MSVGPEGNPRLERDLNSKIEYALAAQEIANQMLAQGPDHFFRVRRDISQRTIEMVVTNPTAFYRGVKKIIYAIRGDRLANSR